MDNIERFLCTGGKFAASTKKSYRRILTILTETCPDIANLTAEALDTWLESRTTWGSAMKWTAYSCIRKYLRWAFGARHPALDLQIKRDDTRPQPVLTFAQAEALLASFDTSTPKGRRDLAICSLTLDCGLRRTELCNLELAELDIEARALKALTKGGKWQDACYSEYTANYLATWLADRIAIVKPCGQRYVFISIGGLTPGCKLDPNGLAVIIRKWTTAAGLKRYLSPHTLRRTFATLASQAGANTRILQKAGRWSTLAMVEHYTRTIHARDMDGWFPTQAIMNPPQQRHRGRD